MEQAGVYSLGKTRKREVKVTRKPTREKMTEASVRGHRVKENHE